jgi:hypothetical protein
MDALYLISHRVRGELAYDVALRILLSGGEERWLIPTSGHRAYPLAYKALAPMVESMTECGEWGAVPDHYSGRAGSDATRKGSGSDCVTGPNRACKAS